MYYIQKGKISLSSIEQVVVLALIGKDYSKWYQSLRKRKQATKDKEWFRSWHKQAIKIRRFEKRHHIKFISEDGNKITWVKT